MPPLVPLLVTSFATWKPEQVSNASDDLLALAFPDDQLPAHIQLLRQIPVDFQLAPAQVIAAIHQLQPQWVVCCGMAECRTYLEIEVQAIVDGKTHRTPANMSQLLSGLRYTQVSMDAGQFVCNHLYHCVLGHLNYLNRHQTQKCQCIFIHVPILTPQNTALILQDFRTLLQTLEVAVVD